VLQVRKCAQVCVEKVFKSLHNPIVKKNSSKAVLFMYRKYMPLSEQLNTVKLSDAQQSKIQSESQHLEALHMFNVLTLLVPSLSENVRVKIISGVYKLLGCSVSSCTGHILRLLEALFEYLKVEHLVSHSDSIFSVLTSYISTDNNPIDTVISASILLRNGLKRLQDAHPSLWIKFLPSIFTSLAGAYACEHMNL